jgi:hypothetical protein
MKRDERVICHLYAFEDEETLEMVYRESENRNARLDAADGGVGSTRQP